MCWAIHLRNWIIFIINVSHAYIIVIECGVGAPVHEKDVVYGLNSTGKRFLSMFMTTVQLPGAATNDSQMVMNTSMSNT